MADKLFLAIYEKLQPKNLFWWDYHTIATWPSFKPKGGEYSDQGWWILGKGSEYS